MSSTPLIETYTGSDVYVTITNAGNYVLTAYGADGGAGQSASGGLGAEVTTDISLAAGTVLQIVVGGAGQPGAVGQPGGGGGGGGGSFIFDDSMGVLLEAAGGGGGGGGLLSTFSGGIGLPGTDSTSGSTHSGTSGAAGTAGQGGSAGTYKDTFSGRTNIYGFDGGGGGGTGSPASPTAYAASGLGGSGGSLFDGANITFSNGTFSTGPVPVYGDSNLLPGAGGAGAQATPYPFASHGGAGGNGGFGGGGGGGADGGGGGGGGGFSGGGGGSGMNFYFGGGGGGSYAIGQQNPIDGHAGGNTMTDLGGDGLVEISYACLCPGTRILTPSGEIPIEDLYEGDMILTFLGDVPRASRITWAGRQHLNLANRPDAPQLHPVRLRAGALADGVPQRDLRLSPRHALFINGALFEALSLVNGVTIIQEQGLASVTYHHIETAEHNLLMSEGALSETFLDHGHKNLFDQTSTPLYPEPHHPHDAQTCAPLITDGPELAVVRATIEGRVQTLKTHITG